MESLKVRSLPLINPSWQHSKMTPTPYGLMLYNDLDMYIGTSLEKSGSWAKEEIERCLPYATGNVVDVGANIGTHTLAFASRAKTVLSFEPVRGIFTVLCANIALNELHNVVAERVALGDRETWESIGEPDFYKIQNLGCYSVGQGQESVQVIPLDRLDIPDVSLIKIDVEGYELKVLRGAHNTIEKCSPFLYIEVPFRETPTCILNELNSLSYEYEYYEDALGEHFPGIAHSYLLAWRSNHA